MVQWRLDRCARLSLWRAATVIALVVALGVGLVGTARTVLAAELAARDVVTALFKSTPDAPVDFSDRDLSMLDFADVDFKKAKLIGADLYGCDLSKASLRGVDLSESRLDRTTIIGADFSGANLEGATLLRPSSFSTLDYDTSEVANFTGARMASIRIIARLNGASFRNADLTKANFAPIEARRDTINTSLLSQLQGVDFSGATMREAKFTRAGMAFANFTGADLTGVVFKEADLTKANFTNADVSGADFTDAVLDGAVFEGTKGLATAKGYVAKVNAVNTSAP